MTAKQSLVLTGLGEGHFDSAVKAIIELQSRFASHLPVDSLQPWSPIKDEDMLCLELSNRYFTPDYLAAGYDVVSIDESIDPLGILRAKAASGKHTEDNVVLYYERLLDKNNKHIYVSCKPVLVKIGLLVEVQASFCTVPISKGRFVMLCKLRSICILDDQVYKDLTNEVFERMKTTAKDPLGKIKRKVGYSLATSKSTDNQDTMQAMKKLRLDEESDKGMVVEK
ncbi:hypothetical protein BDY19DRAFT_998389 [Irpex rosettiformis]|uniref:Uncharacterized protein n=1 Tax=Irpex rosettiformis TaxID=378272 RepID=A0ACB8TNR3_9APHY|nr:hypothetical protein BDY19DRAFT_998389 [Irpex rosettiformis]